MEKIKIEDLSIGDWFQARQCKWDYDDPEVSPPAIVSKIDKGEDYVKLYTDDVGYFYAFVDDLKPIPITQEILENNGINKTFECDDYAAYKCGDIDVLKYYDDDTWSLSKRWNIIYVEHIHELQRALRLLKIEKDIVINNVTKAVSPKKLYQGDDDGRAE